MWVGEVQPRIKSVMEASREVARSRRLRRLLELVLALGNYMNRGARGNASGFRLTSLNRLADTKSSAVKGTTLLHYLVEILEKKVQISCFSHLLSGTAVSLSPQLPVGQCIPCVDDVH